MENIEKEKSLFLDDVAEESEYILETEANTNEHIAYLKPLLSTISSVESKQEIADYGVSKLHDVEDESLAIYFFILSNLKVFSKTTRDFFTDAMVYCEDQMGEYSSSSQLKEQYKKIRPTV